LSVQLQDVAGTALVEFRFDSPESSVYRQFLLANVGTPLTNAIVQVRERGIGLPDASFIANRSNLTMTYTRLSSSLQESKQLGVGPISIQSQLPAEIQGILQNGFLQVSGDQFSWGPSITLGAIQATQQLYIRYVKPTYTTALVLKLTVKNIGADTFQNATLTAGTGDQVSLDGQTWSASVSLGTLAPGASMTVYLQSGTIAHAPVEAELDVYDGSTLLLQFPFDVASGRFYCVINEVKDYLRTIDVDVVTSDEEMRDLIQSCANGIDRATRRRFDVVTVTELYDGSGQQKLVLDNYPILSIQEVKIRNPDNTVVTDIKSTDTNFASELIIDSVKGFITLPSAGIPMLGSQLGAMGWYPPIWAYHPFPAAGVPFDYTMHFGLGVANIEVTYTYGFQTPPEEIRKACMKSVVIELVKKKGASDTQGIASEAIVGVTRTYAVRGSQGGGGPYAHLMDELQSDIDAALELFRKRRWGVV
jgi:hypothetical protein